MYINVITKLGKSFTARVCGSMLKAFNLNEMITTNKKEYENLAFKLAKDRNLLMQAKTKVSKNKFSSNLFDTKKYVLNRRFFETTVF